MGENWERIAEHCQRLKVWGGWVVESWAVTGEGGDRIALCFVPDEKHEWKLTENKPKEGVKP